MLLQRIVETEERGKFCSRTPFCKFLCDNTDAVCNDVREGCCYVTASQAELGHGAERSEGWCWERREENDAIKKNVEKRRKRRKGERKADAI
jgi:hypothetical protein